MRQITSLSYADAMKIIGVVQKELEKQNRGAAVAVADAHGELIASLRTDGCRLPSINIASKRACAGDGYRRYLKVWRCIRRAFGCRCTA
jgi:uncharacterized protein GlcG (DUF336 family)